MEIHCGVQSLSLLKLYQRVFQSFNTLLQDNLWDIVSIIHNSSLPIVGSEFAIVCQGYGIFYQLILASLSQLAWLVEYVDKRHKLSIFAFQHITFA